MTRKRLTIRSLKIEAEGNIAEASALVGQVLAGILGAGERVCRVCGCTDLKACFVTGADGQIRPCSWAAEDLCSRCAG